MIYEHLHDKTKLATAAGGPDHEFGLCKYSFTFFPSI